MRVSDVCARKGEIDWGGRWEEKEGENVIRGGSESVCEIYNREVYSQGEPQNRNPREFFRNLIYIIPSMALSTFALQLLIYLILYVFIASNGLPWPEFKLQSEFHSEKLSRILRIY